jgi:HK97 gp10 family phage protein
MTISVDFRVDAREAIKMLEKLSEIQRSRALAIGAAQAADMVAVEMRKRAPDSGIPESAKRQGKQHKLKKEIEVGPVTHSPTSITISIRAIPYYAIYVEKGTKRMRSHKSKGFMGKAARANRRKAQNVFVDAVKKAIREIAG